MQPRHCLAGRSANVLYALAAAEVRILDAITEATRCLAVTDQRLGRDAASRFARRRGKTRTGRQTRQHGMCSD
jgi:hypothetical protein